MNCGFLSLILVTSLSLATDEESITLREVPETEADMWVAEGRGTVAEIPFRRGNRWGYLDRQGRVVIEPQFGYAGPFRFGRAYAGSKIIDQRGEMVVGIPSYVRSVILCEDCFWFSIEGVREPDQWGLMDYSGKVLIEETYSDVRPFSNGLAAVNRGAQWQFPGHLEGGKWGFVNRDGKEIIPLRYHRVDDFSEGMAVVETAMTDAADDPFPDTKKEIIDANGKVQFVVDGTCWGGFSNGLLAVLSGEQTSYVDRNGTEKFRVQGDGNEFSDGLAVIYVGASDKSVIDQAGEVVFQIKNEASLKEFHEGLASYHDGKNGYGYMDRAGKLVIGPKYNESTDFKNGVTAVHRGGERILTFDGPSWWVNGVTVLLDKQGNELAAIELDEKQEVTPMPATTSESGRSPGVYD